MPRNIYDEFDEYRTKTIYLGKQQKINLPVAYIERNISNYNFRNTFTKNYEKQHGKTPKFSLKSTNKNQYILNLKIKITSILLFYHRFIYNRNYSTYTCL